MKLAVLLVALFASCSAPLPELHVLNWADYFAPDTIANFEKEFRCKVVVDYFDSPDGLRVKMEHVPSGYDVVFPSDEIVPLMVEGGLLDRLDLTLLPNLVNIDAKFRGLSFDPSNSYTIPYMWGTTGVAWQKKLVPEGISSWKQLFTLVASRKVTFLDDGREVLVAAMFANGDDPRRMTQDSIRRAIELVATHKPTGYDSAPRQRLVVGDYHVSHAFSGDALQASTAKERVGDMGFAIPSEGGTIYVDNMAIPTAASHRQLAHAFLNYLLRPEVSAAISNEVQYGNPNASAQHLISNEVRSNPIANPSISEQARCVFLPVLTSVERGWVEKAWAEIKSR